MGRGDDDTRRHALVFGRCETHISLFLKTGTVKKKQLKDAESGLRGKEGEKDIK